MRHWSQSHLIFTAATIPLAFLVGWLVYKKSKNNTNSKKQHFNDSGLNLKQNTDVQYFSEDSESEDENGVDIREGYEESVHLSKEIFAANSIEIVPAISEAATLENKIDDIDLNDSSFQNNRMCGDSPAGDKTTNSIEKSNIDSVNVASKQVSFLEEEVEHHVNDVYAPSSHINGILNGDVSEHIKNEEITVQMQEVSTVSKENVDEHESFGSNEFLIDNVNTVDHLDNSSFVEPSLENDSTLIFDCNSDSSLIDTTITSTKKSLQSNQCESEEKNVNAKHDTNQNNNNSSELSIETLNTLTISSDASSNSFDINSESNKSNGHQNSESLVNGNQHNGWDHDSLSHTEDEEKFEKNVASKKPKSLPKLSLCDNDDSVMTLYVEFLSDKVGLLIGKQGRNIKQLKLDSGANVYVHTAKDRDDIQILEIRGTQPEVESCIGRIKRRFTDISLNQCDKENISSPSSSTTSSTTRSPITTASPPVVYPMANISQMYLPENIMIDVYVSAIAAADCVFVQHYTHPSFHALSNLERAMHLCYSDPVVPNLAKPMQAGLICAAPHQGLWYRAQVVQYFEESDEVLIKFMDHGGYATVSGKKIKQIRADFVNLPFQAIECYLDNIIPPEDEKEFSEEAVTKVADIMKDGRYQARVTGIRSDGYPKIHLYKCQGNKVSLVNREIANKGVATWSGPVPFH